MDVEIVADKFWANDPWILIKKDRLLEFFITSDQSQVERLNAITRFGIYTSILLAMYHNNPRYLALSFIVFAITYFIYSNSESKNEKFADVQGSVACLDPEPKGFTKPTLNNPFMNPSIIEIIDNPEKPRALRYAHNTQRSFDIKKDIKDKFSYNLYRDAGDIYDKMTGSRQFYTVPNTTIAQDPEGKFKQWLYGNVNYSCKDNTYFCAKNNYVPLQSKTDRNWVKPEDELPTGSR
jgi:hypothetical protein